MKKIIIITSGRGRGYKRYGKYKGKRRGGYRRYR